AAVLVGPSARCEAVPPAVPGVLCVQEQVRPEDVIVFELPQAVKRMQNAVFGIEVALVPEERIVFGAGLSGRAPELFLRAVEVEPGDLVVRGCGPIYFRVGVLEDRSIVGLIQPNDADVVAAVRSPEPQLVL